MPEYRAIYKCWLCGEIFTDSLICEREVDMFMEKLETGKAIYRSISGRNDITIVNPHLCKMEIMGCLISAGSKKLSDFNE